MLDTKITQFLTKLGWNPQRGLKSALRSCQDKLLEIFGPLTKLFELAEEAKLAYLPIDAHELTLTGSSRQSLSGNVNTSFSIKRRRAILFKVDPKFSNLFLMEAGKKADGLLFCNFFVRELGQYVGTFTALDKMQVSLRKVFLCLVSSRVCRSRGHLFTRSASCSSGTHQCSFINSTSYQGPHNAPALFPARVKP